MVKKTRPYNMSFTMSRDEKDQLEEMTEYFKKNKRMDISKSDVIRVALKRYYTIYLNYMEKKNNEKKN